jgi:hypothetical protein
MRKILIQNRATRWFLGNDNEWTPDLVRARNFETSLHAVAHCLQKTIPDAQIVMKFDAPGARDMVVPVPAGDAAQPEEKG